MNKRVWINIVAVLAVVIMALVVVVLVVSRDSEDIANEAPESESTSQQATPRSAQEDQSGSLVADAMGRPVFDAGQVPGKPLEQTEPPGGFPADNGLVGPPPGLELQRVSRGVTVAVSTSDGPTGVDQGVLTGFARSARGAALLATLHRARVIAAGPEYVDFLEYYFPEAFKQLSPAMISELEAKDAERMRDYMSTGYLAPSAFKFRFCDQDFCTVETADTPVREALGSVPEEAKGADQYSVTKASMAWQNDHWVILKTDAYNVPELDDSWEKWL